MLDEIKKADPLHDDFSAYHVWKAQQQINEAYEKGKTEKAEIDSGAEPTEKVVSKPGTPPAPPSKPSGPKTPEAVRDSMLDALQRSRAS